MFEYGKVRPSIQQWSNDMVLSPAPRKLQAVSEPQQSAISSTQPYVIEVGLEGLTDLIYNAINAETLEAQEYAKKHSIVRPDDNPEAKVYRSGKYIAIFSEWLHSAMILAAKQIKGPVIDGKSSSMSGLIKAGTTVSPTYAPTQFEEWNYLHRCTVVIPANKARIPRVRPALYKGWQCTFEITIWNPDQIDKNVLRRVIEDAGKFYGLG